MVSILYRRFYVHLENSLLFMSTYIRIFNGLKFYVHIGTCHLLLNLRLKSIESFMSTQTCKKIIFVREPDFNFRNVRIIYLNKQAGAELCQAQGKLRLVML